MKEGFELYINNGDGDGDGDCAVNWELQGVARATSREKWTKVESLRLELSPNQIFKDQ